jgi:hypothetical protein
MKIPNHWEKLSQSVTNSGGYLLQTNGSISNYCQFIGLVANVSFCDNAYKL